MATESAAKTVKRNEKGQFPAGVSGNLQGRPLGSKNKITLLKLSAEEAVRENNIDAMIAVCANIVQEAAAGDQPCRKLVWESMMTKGIAPDAKAQEKVEINITGAKPPKVEQITVIDVEPEDTD